MPTRAAVASADSTPHAQRLVLHAFLGNRVPEPLGTLIAVVPALLAGLGLIARVRSRRVASRPRWGSPGRAVFGRVR